MRQHDGQLLNFLIRHRVPLHVIITTVIIVSPEPRVGASSDDARLTSVCLTSVAYIGPKSRTERPRKTKIGTGVAHITGDADTTFKVRRQKVNLQWAGTYCGGLAHSLLYYINVALNVDLVTLPSITLDLSLKCLRRRLQLLLGRVMHMS